MIQPITATFVFDFFPDEYLERCEFFDIEPTQAGFLEFVRDDMRNNFQDFLPDSNDSFQFVTKED